MVAVVVLFKSFVGKGPLSFLVDDRGVVSVRVTLVGGVVIAMAGLTVVGIVDGMTAWMVVLVLFLLVAAVIVVAAFWMVVAFLVLFVVLVVEL